MAALLRFDDIIQPLSPLPTICLHRGKIGHNVYTNLVYGITHFEMLLNVACFI